MQKTCTKCLISKPLDLFSLNKRNKTDGRQPKCKACNAAYEKENRERISMCHKAYRERVSESRKASQKLYRDKHREKMRLYLSEYYKKNKKEMLAQNKIRYQNNKEYIAKRSSAYAKSHRAEFNAMSRFRKAAQRKAIPNWFEKDKVKEIYKEATKKSQDTGVAYHVDHIVPIVSNIVCGLHCIANLQILTGPENCSKSNRYWPDMP